MDVQITKNLFHHNQSEVRTKEGDLIGIIDEITQNEYVAINNSKKPECVSSFEIAKSYVINSFLNSNKNQLLLLF